jgi:hypothetical protein
MLVRFINPNSTLAKGRIDSRLVISTIRFVKTFTSELHLTKSQHTDYHIFGNI